MFESDLIEKFNLAGRTALVTGASGSIGSAIARLLHSLGAHVHISGRNEQKLSILKNELKDRCNYKICDLSSMKKCESVMIEFMESIPKLDILVCNAGFTEDKLAIGMSNEQFADVVDVNLNANFVLNRLAIKKMLRNKFGRIINISSVVALTGNAGQANYCASKAGLIGMSKAMALEVARRDITINVVAPGFIESNMTGELTEKQKESILQKIPMQRLGKPDDILGVIALLASPASSYITGQTFHVNGGLLLV